jgi:2-dehydropantoate 2-reductase
MGGIPGVGQAAARRRRQGEGALIDVVVFGTGAMACYFGACLVRSGRARATLAGTWPDGLSALARSDVRVEEGGHAWAARVRAVPLDEAPHASAALVLVKSPRTAHVAPYVAASVGQDGVAVTLQNGLGNAEALAAALGPSRLLRGVTTAGATLLRPGHVRAFPAPTVLGRDAAGHAAFLAELLTAAGLPTSVHDDIDAVVWKKLAVNCAINALTALRGVPNGALLERAEDRRLLEAAAREVEMVARASGVHVDAGFADAAADAAHLTAGNRSSMLQDLDRGVPTEIEALNGAVVRVARRLGIRVPVNTRLLEEVRSREEATLGPTPRP